MVHGEPYEHISGSTNKKQSVAFIHQDLGLIDWMSVSENIALAIGFKKKFHRIDWAATETAARDALKLVDADFPPTARIGSLGRTQKSMVAIARALAVQCDFLVLDEPTASLPADEVERLFEAIRPLRDRGVGMIYVSHRLDEVFQIADRVAVLRDGQMVGMRDVRHTNPEELVNLIVGRKAREISRPDVTEGTQILNVANLSAPGIAPTSFEINRREMVGLVGLRGAGHEVVSRCLIGLEDFKGSVTLDGVTPDLATPQTAIAAGIGFVASDRVNESIAPALTIRENAYLNPSISGRKLLSLLPSRREETHAIALGKTVGLSPNDPTLPIEALSGGNQQKVVVGRWVDTNRKLLIAEDPTAGVDVGAKAEIYHLLYQAMADGLGVMVVSTDFEEVANICHRAIVFSRGEIIAELSGVKLSTESLIQAASASDAA